ncbi:MAG: DMT family transporter [Clostridiales Family XIII bacterium]|jgi:drug/metabolite transporter (DMT)-like permease|nr:DMT family transporter [Clostridiales Family XIII bacterium]
MASEIQNNRHNVIKSTSVLTLTALIWGMGFVAQRSAMEHVGPFFFNGMRTALGALTIVIVLLISNLIERKKNGVTAPKPSALSPEVLKGGVLCGIALFLAGNLQQVGLVFTAAGKAGFLTALYIVLVPILGIFLKHKTHWNTWGSVLIAAAGLYCLSITENFSILIGDLVVIIGAFFWACHILVVDHYVAPLGHLDVMKLCICQFVVAGLLGLLCWPLFDKYFTAGVFRLSDLILVLPALLYAGVVSTGAGFTLQAIGQRYANPSAASIIMSLESVFSLIGGILILHEILTGKEILGCILMFAAVLLAQLPLKRK